jgi:hypothetical protein
MLEKYGRELLEYSGGPIAVSNCEVCQGRPSKDMCYHCGKQPWMRSRQDLKTARRDMKQYTRYHITTPIHAAAMASNFEMVEKLISFGASVNHKDSTGCTALHWVACSGHLSATKTENVRIAPGSLSLCPDPSIHSTIHILDHPSVLHRSITVSNQDSRISGAFHFFGSLSPIL